VSLASKKRTQFSRPHHTARKVALQSPVSRVHIYHDDTTYKEIATEDTEGTEESQVIKT
jgi:hypothetical protein